MLNTHVGVDDENKLMLTIYVALFFSAAMAFQSDNHGSDHCHQSNSIVHYRGDYEGWWRAA
jgi:hypothetical protein